MPEFDSVAIYALLDNSWTDLSGYVRGGSVSASWGIMGEAPEDILADIGELHFTLNNSGGEFYPDGGSAMSGWGTGIKVKLVFTYDSVPYTRFLGYVPKDGLDLHVAKSANHSSVDVTALDWMVFTSETPILKPSIETDKTADEAIQSVLEQVPNKVFQNADTGDYTFPAIFDSTQVRTTAYAELSKIGNSESPGRIYLIKSRYSGEQLVFENSTHRASHAQATTVSLEQHHIQNHDGGYIQNHNGGYILNHAPTESGSAAVTLNSDIDEITPSYGANIVNRATAIATPKRVDSDPQVLYRLPSPIELDAGQTKYIKGRYVDPQGGPTKVIASVGSMVEPVAPGTDDPHLVSLLNFNVSPIVDDTERHVWTQNDVTQTNDVYKDGFGTTYISGGALGGYGVFGGYADYNLTAPSSSDFDFGNGAFTLGYYVCQINPDAGNNVLTRDYATNRPPYLLGVPDGEDSNMGIYMSSDGVSWDVAKGDDTETTFGPVQVGKWVYCELGRDENGFFYSSADGEIISKWYSAAALPANSGTFSIGRTQVSGSPSYGYFGFDSFFIRKGECLHTSDFEPPKRNINATLDGDFLLNSAKKGSGTDLTDDLAIKYVYHSSYPEYWVTNQSSTNGYLIHLQARGLGIYPYDDIDISIEDQDSITEYGYETLTVRQPYQQDLEAGKVWMTDIVTKNADGKTKLEEISF
ncbi:MAG: hypothetical protein GY771_04265, partial [bacterium]|nr:hypothetical protein [bacterium]